jgi:hypothetical protein
MKALADGNLVAKSWFCSIFFKAGTDFMYNLYNTNYAFPAGKTSIEKTLDRME